MDTLIKKDIESDFYNCLGAFRNFSLLMDAVPNLTINTNDSEEIKKIKQGQIDGALVQLGRIGELAFKYLLKLKQIELYPNQDYKQFSDTERIYKKGPISNLVNKKMLSKDDADEITTFKDENEQKFHNFTYLGLVVKKLLPDTYKNFEKCIDYDIQSQAVLEVLSDMNKRDFDWEIRYGYYGELVIFPCLIWLGDINIDTEKLKTIVSTIKDKASSSGDIFTRLRYFSNNQGNKQYDVNDLREIFSYIKNLVKFIEGIHRNNNNLLTNSEYIHGREQALKYPKFIGRVQEEIAYIFDEFLDDKPVNLCMKLFSGYGIQEMKEIEKLCKKYGLSSWMVFDLGINLEELVLLHNNGCGNSYSEMQYYVYEDSGRRRTTEEIKTLIQNENKPSNIIKK